MARSIIPAIILPGSIAVLCFTLSCMHMHASVPAPGSDQWGRQTECPVRLSAAEGGLPFGTDDDLYSLARFMSGHFTSEEHAAGDSSYLDIRLVMEPIWAERADGIWMYVEQAVAGYENHPYRQRVYRLIRRGPNELESAVFLLPDPKRFIGAWRDPERFADLQPDDLEPRSGCTIHLSRGLAGTFQGSTRGHDCRSDLRGATYATASVRIEDGLMYTWDQGFAATGEQVWGPTEGGYVFRRRSEH